MISRTSSTPVWLAASISITSIWRPSAIATHGSHTPQGSIVGPPCPSGPMQLSALAISRAVEVLPTPRTPVSRKAWAMPPALDGVGRASAPSRPGRSARRRSAGGICGRARGNAPRRQACSGCFGKVEPEARRFVVHGAGLGALNRVIARRDSVDLQSGRLAVSHMAGGSRRPGTKSLWLLPSGSDQVGDSAVRRLPRAIWGSSAPRQACTCSFIDRSRG